MMMSNSCDKCNPKSDGSYASSFKKVMVLGGPTLEEIRNSYYITEEHEAVVPNADGSGFVRMRFDAGSKDEIPGNFDPKSVFVLDPGDPAARQEVREINLVGKDIPYDQAWLIQDQTAERGFTVIGTKLLDGSTDIKWTKYCNIFMMPYAKLSEVIQGEDKQNGLLIVKIKDVDVIKLKVTVKSTELGEAEYRTHDTQIILDNSTEGIKSKLKQYLEYDVAKKVSEILKILPNKQIPQQNLEIDNITDPILGTAIAVGVIAGIGLIVTYLFIPPQELQVAQAERLLNPPGRNLNRRVRNIPDDLSFSE